MKSSFPIAILISVSILLSATILKAEPTKEEIAVRQAETWLAVVDSGNYEESWNLASDFFKAAVPKDQWLSSMNAFRKPLGKLIERKIINRQFTTSLPGAPDGEYVVIQFGTEFENKKESTETITPMLDSDGKWRVSGYFIK